MRVLAVGNMYPPHHFGGYELIWRSAVEHLRAQGHEVRVLTTDTRTATARPDDPGVHRELSWHLRDGEFERLGYRARTRLARHNHRVLERHLGEFEPDVVAWWSMGGLSLTLLESVRRRGLSAVAFVLDDWLDYGRGVDHWLGTFTGKWRRHLAPAAERLARIPARVDFAEAATYSFISEYTQRRAMGQELGLRRTGVAHSGIDPAFLEPASEQDWGWRLLYLGRIDPRKGIDTALEALSGLPSEATLTIVGGWDAREEERLRTLGAELGVAERVRFAGHCDRDELLRAYADCDAVVFPSRWEEPWGLVPLEAMGRGRPVAATGRGGSGEYLRDGENCVLFEAGDAEGLAAALRRLAEQPELRAHLREGGFATAARHTEPIYNAEVERELLDAVSPAPRASPEGRPLRVLHLGAGFRPWRRGGLVAYVEDVAWEQMMQGHDVSYLCSGRHYRGVRGPRLRRWRRRSLLTLEIVNSPLYDHGGQPELELAEPRLEALLENVLRERRPDVVHVHELAGFPSSVLDVARRAGVPVVLTLQDYFPLCSSFKLFDSERRLCLRREIGDDCAATLAARPADPALLFEATLRYDLHKRWLVQRIPAAPREALVAWLAHRLSRGAAELRDPASEVSAFQRRRDVNVERLNRADGLIAMSERVGEIYGLLGVEQDRLRTMRLTLAHIERLEPRRREASSPVTFATLGGGESEAKGSRLLLEAARSLGDLAEAGRVRLLVFGHVEGAVEEELAGLPGVEVRGRYLAHELDELLAEVHVGLMPSVWEEAYGYAGVEFLAAGVPVIANAIGGMVEYVHEGRTGWLNRACTAEGLAGIMRGIVARPAQVGELNARLLADRDSIVLPLGRHVQELDAAYREVIAAAASN